MKEMIIDLGSGQKSLEQPALDIGFTYISVDNNPKNNPDITIDIRDTKQLIRVLPKRPLAIWFSPPCTGNSIAAVSHHWKEEWNGLYYPFSKIAKEGVEILEAGIEVIKALKPKYWFIENPVGMMGHLPWRRYFPSYKCDTVHYCQYGDTRMKPTWIWYSHDLDWIPRPLCWNGRKNCHELAPRGSRTGTQGLKNAKERGKVPYELHYEILSACLGEQEMKEGMQYPLYVSNK